MTASLSALAAAQHTDKLRSKQNHVMLEAAGLQKFAKHPRSTVPALGQKQGQQRLGISAPYYILEDIYSLKTSS